MEQLIPSSPTFFSVHEVTVDSDIMHSLTPPKASEDENGEERREEKECVTANNVCFEDLPSDIHLYIFSFLPLPSIGPLVRVCKTWSDLLRDPNNMELLLGRKLHGRSNSNPIYLLGEANHKGHSTDLYILDSTRISTSWDSKVNVGKEMFMAASNSGFICCCPHSRQNEFLLCNPLTQERVKLPEINEDGRHINGYSVFGLGIDITFKKQSKLVRMLCNILKERWVIECDVYTFGSNSWRTVEVPKFRPRAHATLCHWKLYWIRTMDFSSLVAPILTFDLESEKFSLVSPPKTKEGSGMVRFSYIINLREELCYVVVYEGETRIHVLEDDTTMVWSLRRCFNPGVVPDCRMLPCGLWTNNALLMKGSRGIYCYDLDETSVREICVPGGWRHGARNKYFVGPYFPNFMSPGIFLSQRH